MTKNELSQLFWLEKEVTQQKERLAELESAARNITSPLTGAPRKSEKTDKTGNVAIQIADMKTLLDLSIQKCWREKNRLMRYIMEIDDSLMRQIMLCRFVDCLNWIQVAWKIGGNNTAESVKKACYRFLER